jgi:integrase
MGESNRLTAIFVKQVKTPGIFRDGGGLLLRVEPSGSRRWILRTSVSGKRVDIGLGSARDVSLQEARVRASELRREARAGRNPLAKRREAKGELLSFEAATRAVHAQRQGGWRNIKHGAQWLRTLETYVFPFFGSKPVADIEPADVLGSLSPIWLAKPETARRIRQRIRVVLDWAVAAGHRSQLVVNAADAVRMGLPKQPRRDGHHPAIPWKELPMFISALRERSNSEVVRLCLEFTVLTAARSGESRGATWSEIDLDKATWTVPAMRMKGNRFHRIPLASRAIEILLECQALWPTSDLVFPGREGKPISDMTLTMLMRRLGRAEVPHGCRATFRDWCADNRWDRELAEAALAHVVASKTEAAYRRSDLFDARRPLMSAWAAFATRECHGSGHHGN